MVVTSTARMILPTARARRSARIRGIKARKQGEDARVPAGGFASANAKAHASGPAVRQHGLLCLQLPATIARRAPLRAHRRGWHAACCSALRLASTQSLQQEHFDALSSRCPWPAAPRLGGPVRSGRFLIQIKSFAVFPVQSARGHGVRVLAVACGGELRCAVRECAAIEKQCFRAR